MFRNKIKLITSLALIFTMTITTAAFAVTSSNTSEPSGAKTTLSCDFVMSPDNPVVGSDVVADGSAHCYQLCGLGYYHFDMMLQDDFKKPVVTSHTNLPTKEFKRVKKAIWINDDYCWDYDSGIVLQTNADMWIALEAEAETQNTGRHWGKWGSGSWYPDVFDTDYVEVYSN